MQREIENPVPLSKVAAQVGLSSRQLERLFLRHLQMTPLRFYMQLRVERARELLLYSDRPVLEVAVAAGFASTSHFASWYKRVFGMKPSEVRGPKQPAAVEAVAPSEPAPSRAG
jgi:transcriptional regulator GlxA family with amidase domain